MSNSSIWPLNRTLSSSTTPDLSEPRIHGNVGVFPIPQSSSITGASLSDCLTLYVRIIVGGVLPLGKEAVNEFYNPSQLDWLIVWFVVFTVCLLLAYFYVKGFFQAIIWFQLSTIIW